MQACYWTVRLDHELVAIRSTVEQHSTLGMDVALLDVPGLVTPQHAIDFSANW